MNVTKVLTHRDALAYWLNDNQLVGEGAEIGSAQGQFAAKIMSVWKGKKLYMVDPWNVQTTQEYPEKHNHIDFDHWYSCCQAMAENDNRIQLMKMMSVEAVSRIRNMSLDWVYIDANHAYGHVLEDLDLWYPKVKVGGLFGGHDFYTNTKDGNWCEVDSAVERWTRERNITFTVTPCTSWWSIK